MILNPLRSHFPVFQETEVCFLDSASSSQKPREVICAMTDMMHHSYANIHRGSYDLSERAETIYHHSKELLSRYLWLSPYEVFYTYNATYAANFLARTLVKSGKLKRGDIIGISLLEHHANVVPWQIIAEEYGLTIEWIPLDTTYRIDIDHIARDPGRYALLALSLASNVLGSTLDISKLDMLYGSMASRPLIVLDGSQYFPHASWDLRSHVADVVFGTWHKMLADTGIGFFAGRKEFLRELDPALCGGGAINEVTESGYTPAWLPSRFEPGTPHIIGAASLAAAIQFLMEGERLSEIQQIEKTLVHHALEAVKTLPSGVHLFGSTDPTGRLWVFSFSFDHAHPRDVADYLADHGVAVRAGHHCAEPLHRAYGIPATLRMSTYLYNDTTDIDRFFSLLATYPHL